MQAWDCNHTVAHHPMKTGILLINLGTPDNPRPAAVGRYLTEFLSDGRVIDIPWLPRQILVRGIISPLRRFSSSKEYKKVWTEDGSPLLLHGQELTRKVAERCTALSNSHPELGEIHVHFAMRYQQPSMPMVLEEMRQKGYDRIVVLPLYAQYASATTGSTHQEAMRLISKWYVIPEIRLISQYWDDEGYLSCFAQRGSQFDLGSLRPHFVQLPRGAHPSGRQGVRGPPLRQPQLRVRDQRGKQVLLQSHVLRHDARTGRALGHPRRPIQCGLPKPVGQKMAHAISATRSSKSAPKRASRKCWCFRLHLLPTAWRPPWKLARNTWRFLRSMVESTSTSCPA